MLIAIITTFQYSHQIYFHKQLPESRSKTPTYPIKAITMLQNNHNHSLFIFELDETDAITNTAMQHNKPNEVLLINLSFILL